MTRLFPPDADCVARIHAQLERLLEIQPPAFAHLGVRLTPEGISTLVETAFWAGLQTNEGRTARVRIAVALPGRLAGATRFDRPIPYNPAEIVRLAPAVASDRCLCADEVDEQFQIWGITDRLAIAGLRTVTVETTEPGTVRG
jgi:hypothetical protein